MYFTNCIFDGSVSTEREFDGHKVHIRGFQKRPGLEEQADGLLEDEED